MAGVAITRMDISAADLRAAAERSVVLDGFSREEAAQLCGMDRQTLRDWVHRPLSRRHDRGHSQPAGTAHGLWPPLAACQAQRDGSRSCPLWKAKRLASHVDTAAARPIQTTLKSWCSRIQQDDQPHQGTWRRTPFAPKCCTGQMLLRPLERAEKPVVCAGTAKMIGPVDCQVA